MQRFIYKLVSKRILLLILALFLIFTWSCKPSTNTDTDTDKETPVKKENKYMLAEEEACFNFFWELQNVNTALGGCGLIPDRYPSNGAASIASVGYGLAAFVIGVENNWITKEEGYERAVLTLNGMTTLTREHGFYYHFYSEKLGTPSSGSEISNIDTAIFLCGALLAGIYFGDEVNTMANKIYEEVDWTWFLDKSNNQFYMSYNPNTKKFAGHWDYYAEQLMMYFLAAGSPTYPVGKTAYDSFTKYVGSYNGIKCINSWYGSLFTYQFSHAFIDFRNIVDSDGVNWFDNSVIASQLNYQYCVDNSDTYLTYSSTSWGITACDTPSGYSGLLGSYPSGRSSTPFKNDGTIAACGAIGSIVFVPELVLPCFENYSTMLDGKLIGEYGYKDAFNFENGIWIATSSIGIDKGIELLMIENYRSELIWKYFMQLELMDRAIVALGFTEV